MGGVLGVRERGGGGCGGGGGFLEGGVGGAWGEELLEEYGGEQMLEALQGFI